MAISDTTIMRLIMLCGVAVGTICAVISQSDAELRLGLDVASFGIVVSVTAAASLATLARWRAAEAEIKHDP